MTGCRANPQTSHAQASASLSPDRYPWSDFRRTIAVLRVHWPGRHAHTPQQSRRALQALAMSLEESRSYGTSSHRLRKGGVELVPILDNYRRFTRIVEAISYIETKALT